MKKMQYSKLLPMITGIIFVGCLIRGFMQDFSTAMDTTFFVTTISVSGGLFGASLLGYLRKAQLENVQQIKGNVYKLATDERIRFLEETFKLKQKYGVTDQEIEEVELSSPMDEFENDALNSMAVTSDQAMDEASEKVEIPNY